MRKDKTIHLGPVECIASDSMRLLITFQGIHLEQVKGEAADFHPSPDFPRLTGPAVGLYVETQDCGQRLSPLWLTAPSLRVSYSFILQ